jgi:predicted O-methyltransferase YrrM
LGTAQWYSTIIAAEVLQQQWAHIRTREVSYPQYKKALSHFAHYGYKGITAYYADATTTVWEKFTNNKFDVVFLDAQKSKYHELLESIRPHVTSDWYIIIDDVIKFKQKMISLYHRLDESDIEYTVHHLDNDDGIIVIHKKEEITLP